MANIRFTNFSGLLNAGVSDFLMENNELSLCKNVWEYKIGLLEKVPGYTLVGDKVVDDKSVNFLHHYYDTTNRNNYLLAFSDSGSNYTCEYRTTGNFATATGISTTWDTYAGSQPSVANYLGKAFIVGHKATTTYLPNATIDGTTFSAADSDISGMPQGKFIVRYRDLLYVLHAKTGGTVYPCRACYCDEPTAGAIGWTGIATRFVEFGYDDGDEITGGAECLDRLIAFKQYSMWTYDESERKKIADIGCDSYRSIQNIGNTLYWFNRNGFWRWNGGEPVNISQRFQPFIDAIDQAKLNEVVSAKYNNGYEYRAYIGDVTVNGTTYANSWFCWDTRKNKCYLRCTYDKAKSACTYVEAGKMRAYFGNDDGDVMKFAEKVDGVYSDNTQPIDAFFITRNLDFGVPEDRKQTARVWVFTKNAQGLNLSIDVDNADSFQWGKSQVVKKNVDDFYVDTFGNRYRYKFYEKSSSKSFEFEGFVVSTEIKEEKQ